MALTPDTLQFIRDHASEDVQQLALRGTRNADVDLPLALDQIRGRQVARQKLPSWAKIDDIIYPPHLSLEQCSSESTGRYKQEVVRRLLAQKFTISSTEIPCVNPAAGSPSSQLADTAASIHTGGAFCTAAPSIPSPRISSPSSSRLVDLTGGFGVDFSFLAPLFTEPVYVEEQERLCAIARHNFPLLGLSHARVVCGQAEHFLDSIAQMSSGPQPSPGMTTPSSADGDAGTFADLIFMDPARRDAHGARTYGLADCTPNVLTLLSRLLACSRRLLFKLSPMLDVFSAVNSLNEAAGRSVVSEVHVVAVANECKELLLVLCDSFCGSPALYCANESPQGDGSPQRFSCPLDGSNRGHYPQLDRWPQAGEWIFEPNAAIMKASCFAPLCQAYHLTALGPNSHLFVAPTDIPAFPGRRFLVVSVGTLGKRSVREQLADVTSANITVRNFPMTAVQLRKRLKLKDGGDTFLFATTLADGQHALLRCVRPQ